MIRVWYGIATDIDPKTLAGERFQNILIRIWRIIISIRSLLPTRKKKFYSQNRRQKISRNRIPLFVGIFIFFVVAINLFTFDYPRNVPVPKSRVTKAIPESPQPQKQSRSIQGQDLNLSRRDSLTLTSVPSPKPVRLEKQKPVVNLDVKTQENIKIAKASTITSNSKVRQNQRKENISTESEQKVDHELDWKYLQEMTGDGK